MSYTSRKCTFLFWTWKKKLLEKSTRQKTTYIILFFLISAEEIVKNQYSTRPLKEKWRKLWQTMSLAPEWNILRAFEPFFGLLTCANAENFRDPKKRTLSIARVIILAILWTSYTYMLFADLWFRYGFGFDFRIVAFPFAVLINGTQLMITFDSLRRNAEGVKQTIVTLSEMVDKREFFFGYFFFEMFRSEKQRKKERRRRKRKDEEERRRRRKIGKGRRKRNCLEKKLRI